MSRATSQLIFQPFRCFIYVTVHSTTSQALHLIQLANRPWYSSPTFPSLHLRHNSFSKPSVALPTSQLILQHLRHFNYVTTHYPTLPPLYLRHSSFSNLSVTLPTSQLILQPSVASPTSQFILQPFFRFSYVTSSSLNSPGELPME